MKYVVRLLDDTKESNLHWHHIHRLAGPGVTTTNKELVESAQHDKQKFKVEKFLDWVVNTDGEVDLLIKWRSHE